MISIDGIMIAKCVPAKIIYTFMPFQPSCQREYAFRRTGFGDDGHIGKDSVSPSEEPGEPQSDNREETITASSSVFYKSDHV